MSPENGVPDFIEIAHVEQIPDGSGAPFKAAGKDVALFNVGGDICAFPTPVLTLAARWD